MAMDEMTEHALRGLLDRERIVALADRCFAAVDQGEGLDAEWAGSIFSADVRVEHRGFTLEGLEEVAAGNRFVREGWDRTFHASSNHQVELDGDRAHLRSQLLAIHVHRDATPPEPYVIANVYEADAVRTPDGWRFRSIGFRPVWSSGQSHLDLEAGDR